MKQILAMIILVSFSLVGCEKDDSDDLTPNSTISRSQLKGTWVEQSYRFEYFDDNNNKAHTENNDNRWLEKIVVDDATVTWVWTETGNAPTTVNYRLLTERGKNYILLTGNDNKTNKVEITDFKDKSMEWVSRGPSATYMHNGITKTASYTTTTISFSK